MQALVDALAADSSPEANAGVDASLHVEHASALCQPLLGDQWEGSPHTEASPSVTWNRSGGMSCRILTEEVKPCTNTPFYGKYVLSGSPGLFTIEEACSKSGRGNNVGEILGKLLVAGHDPDYLEGVYDTPWKQKIKIHAVHMAASTGSLEVLQWLKDKCRSDVLNQPAIMDSPNEDRTEPVLHYTPLMSAMFMSQVDACIWLLDNGASASARNADGFTPLHLLAWLGMPHSSEDTRVHSIQLVARKLVDKNADLTKSSGPMLKNGIPRQDKHAMNFRNKTALQIAAGQSSTYPKHMLHLLTQCYHFPAYGKLFIEVNIISKANPTAAVELLSMIQQSTTKLPLVQEQLRREVMASVADGCHMTMFVETLKMSPIAGTMLLSLLMAEPKIDNPQRYPLPQYTVLPNREMLCTCQPAEGNEVPIWKHEGGEANPPPKWHSQFKRELPSDPLLHKDVYPVKVRVLYMPGVLNLRVMSILSRVWSNWESMKIFSRIPIRAVVEGMWQRHYRVWLFHFTWKVVLLLSLLHAGIIESSSDFLREELVCIVIVANLFFEAANIMWALLISGCLGGIPVLRYLSNFLVFELINWFALLILYSTPRYSPTGQEKVYVAVNILLRSLDVISSMSVLPVVGPMMIAVLQSFAPMLGMFMIMGMMFLTYAFTFLSIKDPERSSAYVLLNLYQALFLTDSDGAESISGIDLAHQQTLDIGVEMYTGGGSSWLLGASTYIMVFATSTFSLVLLNLTIGMYSKYYEEMEPLANLSFQQQRARLSVSFMLRPRVPARVLRRVTSLGAIKLLTSTAIPTFVLFVFAMYQSMIMIGGAALAALLLLYQAVLLAHISDVDRQHHYLWVSYRSDFNEEFFSNQGGEIAGLRSMLSAQQKEIAGLKEEVDKLSGLKEEFNKQSTQLSQTMQDLLESSRDCQSYLKEFRQREHSQNGLANGNEAFLPSTMPTSSILRQSSQSIGGNSFVSRPVSRVPQPQGFAGHAAFAPQAVPHVATMQTLRAATVAPMVSARQNAAHRRPTL